MTKDLTTMSLINILNDIRDVLLHFDYSSISNVVFLNVNSLYFYMKNVDDNPFILQYKELDYLLNLIENFFPLYDNHDIIDSKIKLVYKIKDLNNKKQWFKFIKNIEETY